MAAPRAAEMATGADDGQGGNGPESGPLAKFYSGEEPLPLCMYHQEQIEDVEDIIRHQLPSGVVRYTCAPCNRLSARVKRLKKGNKGLGGWTDVSEADRAAFYRENQLCYGKDLEKVLTQTCRKARTQTSRIEHEEDGEYMTLAEAADLPRFKKDPAALEHLANNTEKLPCARSGQELLYVPKFKFKHATSEVDERVDSREIKAEQTIAAVKARPKPKAKAKAKAKATAEEQIPEGMKKLTGAQIAKISRALDMIDDAKPELCVVIMMAQDQVGKDYVTPKALENALGVRDKIDSAQNTLDTYYKNGFAEVAQLNADLMELKALKLLADTTVAAFTGSAGAIVLSFVFLVLLSSSPSNPNLRRSSFSSPSEA